MGYISGFECDVQHKKHDSSEYISVPMAHIDALARGRVDNYANCVGYDDCRSSKDRSRLLENSLSAYCLMKDSKGVLCPLEKLEAVQKKMKAVNLLNVMEGGDHLFKIVKKHLQSEGSTQEEIEDPASWVLVRK